MIHRVVLSGFVALALLLGLRAQAFGEEKRTRYFELQPQVGYAWVNLTGFSQEQFLEDAEADLQPSLESGEVPVEGFGPSAGLGAQLKFWVFVLGSRYNYTHTSDFGMHTVGADLGLRLGDDVALYGRAGLGLVFLSSLPSGLQTDGFMLPASGGLEFKLGEAASLGLGLDVEVLLLTQAQKLQDAATMQLQPQEIDRDSIGFQLRPQLHVTWHL